MGGGGSRIPPPPPIPRVKVFNSLKPNTSAPASVESVVLSRKDPRQQWQIVLQPDKKFMKLKNVANGKFLYLGLEPLTGENQFSTIDLDKTIDGKKANYKYSPVFSKVTENDIDNATTFNFISSFGPQMDIIDKSSKVIEKSTAKLYSKKGNRLTLTTPPGGKISLFGIFMFAKDGTIINKDTSKVYMNSVSGNQYATNALKIVNQNSGRTIQQAFAQNPLNVSNPDWNKFSFGGGTDWSYCAISNNEAGGGIWEYDNVNPVDLSLLEIYSNSIGSGLDGLKIELYNDNVSNSKSVWSRTIQKTDYFDTKKNTFTIPLIVNIK